MISCMYYMYLQDTCTKEDGTLGDARAGKYKVKEEQAMVANVFPLL